jgi:Mor family transcriptional regulator
LKKQRGREGERMKDANDDFKLLKEIVGQELTVKIVEEFAGSFIYIPKNILTTKKHLEILEGYKSGKNYRELSLMSGYSENYIRNIISMKNKADVKQLGLFQNDFDKNIPPKGGNNEDD